jgi:hypothetical protein
MTAPASFNNRKLQYLVCSINCRVRSFACRIIAQSLFSQYRALRTGKGAVADALTVLGNCCDLPLRGKQVSAFGFACGTCRRPFGLADTLSRILTSFHFEKHGEDGSCGARSCAGHAKKIKV